MSGESDRYLLHESDLPQHWYNLAGHLEQRPAPPLDPRTLEPLDSDTLTSIFPAELIKQEMSEEPFIRIPEPVLEVYHSYRPSPLHRARRFEELLDTPAHIYYKHEGLSPPGSHKPNTAVPNAYFAEREGTRRLVTGTGAGQWGSALAYACKLFGLECTVYMARVSHDQKPYRRILMETWGAEVLASPSTKTEVGRALREQQPEHPGSVGSAIGEAGEDAVTHEDTRVGMGSFFNCVLMHQTVIGEEALLQMELAGEYPGVVIGCVGAGSNFSGLAFPFLRDKLAGDRDCRFLAVETSAVPTLTRGVYQFDHADPLGTSPLAKMYTLGHTFLPSPIHAGGLRDVGVSPLLSLLYQQGLVEAVAYPQLAVFEAAVQFARTEGVLPAPESAYAVRAAMDQAREAREEGEERVILFNLSGHGYFDLEAYDEYLSGRMEDHVASEDQLDEARQSIPEFANR